MAISFNRLMTITIPPKNPESFDFAWVDPGPQLFYLTDRTNAGITIVDARTGRFLETVKGCVGVTGKSETSGPNGLEVVPSLNQLWAGDGDSTAKVMDIKTRKMIRSIPTGGRKRLDLLAFDPKDKIILACNDKDDPPFISFISATDFTVLGKIEYQQAAFGPEQPLWNPNNDKFYVAITQTKTDPGGEVHVVDPRTMEVTNVFSGGDSMPVGLALGPKHNLLVGGGGVAIAEKPSPRSLIMDERDGSIIKTVYEVSGSDQVWYNPGDSCFYLAANALTADGTKAGVPTPVLGIIDATTNMWLANVPTGLGAHSIAVNPKDNHAFVPIRGAGIAVFARQRG